MGPPCHPNNARFWGKVCFQDLMEVKWCSFYPQLPPNALVVLAHFETSTRAGAILPILLLAVGVQGVCPEDVRRQARTSQHHGYRWESRATKEQGQSSSCSCILPGRGSKGQFSFVNNDNLSRICIQTDTFDPRHLLYTARADLCLI